MIAVPAKQRVKDKALLWLRSTFQRKSAKHKTGRTFMADPNFQRTKFSDEQLDRLDWHYLGNGMALFYREHSPSIYTKEYIITYQIRTQP